MTLLMATSAGQAANKAVRSGVAVSQSNAARMTDVRHRPVWEVPVVGHGEDLSRPGSCRPELELDLLLPPDPLPGVFLPESRPFVEPDLVETMDAHRPERPLH